MSFTNSAPFASRERCVDFAAFRKAGVKDGAHNRADRAPESNGVYHPETGRIARLRSKLADYFPLDQKDRPTMTRRYLRPLGFRLLAAGLLAVPLAACGVAGLGTFGNSRLQVAEINDIGSYTAGSALVRARAHFRNNDFGYSAAFYKRVVELSPKDEEGYVGLGASYDRMRRFDLSDRVYASLFAISGGTAQYYNNVGYSYLLRGKLKDAMSNFRKAQSLAPDSVVIANNIQLVAQATATARI